MNVTGGHFPFDLIFFALVAVFLVLRLRSVLGKKAGLQPGPVAPPQAPQPSRGAAVVGGQKPASDVSTNIPAPATRVGQELGTLRSLDQSFTPEQFLSGAEGAFRQIVTAFAAGNRPVLQERLTPAAFAAFESAIITREQAGETQKSEIRSVQSMAIEDVRKTDLAAGTGVAIDVRIVSDQISLTLDSSQQPVAGTDAVTEFSDLWTFERLYSGSTGGSWRLAAARSA
ncbi:Tim44/TimA family putative adaptor protein [Acetobacter sp. AN02]|uniref:Tim44/TimA family putative adaptor protein n=1 Tax=Acetobacter sp. AN02 TaxID=2894186 RepID=UPI002434656D|nr:Tim44/TimA family putative adaptor protein [Acetobacter sp. AN02]MDG6093591.1 Tim44/TimA family putative adaptor protein [Acetobacter sp. AN02]